MLCAMPKIKEERDMERAIINNLTKYFETPVRKSPENNDAAFLSAVHHYFKGKED
jgi:hypothetical protein